MHRTNRNPQLALSGLLLGLTLSGSVFAQNQPVTPPAAVPAQTTARFKTIIVPINGTQKIQSATKKRIQTVLNQRDTVARVAPIATDPTSVLVTGLEPGIARVTLIDEANNQESYEIIVQLDVEFLRSLLLRAVPTANIQLIPAASNTIILTGYVARAEEVDVIMRTAVSVVGANDKVVNALRVGGVQQVQLDVVVAQVNRTALRNMASDLVASGPSSIFGTTIGGTPALSTIGTTPPSTFNSSSSGGGSSGGSMTTGALTGGMIGASPGAANLFLGITTGKTSYLLFLQALKQEGLVKLLAEPRVVSLSGRPASFLSGGEQAVPVPAGLGQVGVQFEEFGTRLNFLPIVLGNGKIHLEVEPEVSSLNQAFGTSISGTVVPGRSTQRIHTTVQMEEGQTYILGGLIQNTVQATVTKVPVIGEIPYLGALFSTKSFTEDETELIVMVTPHLVDAMSCDQAPKTLPGQETRSADDFELFLEGILEAPRGPRTVCPDGHYVPAYKNGPTSNVFPCNGDSRHGNSGCRAGNPVGTPGNCALPVSGAPEHRSVAGQDATPPIGSDGTGSGAGAAPATIDKPTMLPPSPVSPAGSPGQK